jgi:hypothetical protein
MDAQIVSIDNGEEKPLNIQVNTTEYEKTHSKIPEGHGVWSYSLNSDGSNSKTTAPMTYSAMIFLAKIDALSSSEIDDLQSGVTIYVQP